MRPAHAKRDYQQLKSLLELGPGAVIGRAEIAILLGVSSRSMPRIEKRKGFPAPLPTGGHKCWRLGDVRDWLNGLVSHQRIEDTLQAQGDLIESELPRIYTGEPAAPGEFRFSVVRSVSDAREPLTVVGMEWSSFAAALAAPEMRFMMPLAERLCLVSDPQPRARAHARREKNGPAWLPATFGSRPNVNGNLRWNENVLTLSALVLDIDNKGSEKTLLTPEQVISAMPSGLAVAWHTTFSHRPEAPRFRVVIPWAIPITPQQHRQAFKAAQHRFAGCLDPVSESPAALYFLPSCAPDVLSQFSSGVQGKQLAKFDELAGEWSR